MGEERRVLTDMERIERNRRIAMAYYSAYDKHAVKDGATYDDWVYASHAGKLKSAGIDLAALAHKR